MVQTVQNLVEFTQVQFLDEVVFMPVVGQRLAHMVQTVPIPVEFPQVQFWDEVVFMPVVGQRLGPHGTFNKQCRNPWSSHRCSRLPMVSLTMEILQLQLIDKVFDGRLCMFIGCRRGEDSRAPQF